MRGPTSGAWLLLVASAPCLAADAPSDAKAFVEGHQPMWTITVPVTTGLRIARLPDLTGDGIDDLAGGTQEADLSIYSGADATRVRELVPRFSDTLFAAAVADAGDVDRDGVHDVAVGTSGANLDGGRGTVRWYS